VDFAVVSWAQARNILHRVVAAIGEWNDVMHFCIGDPFGRLECRMCTSFHLTPMTSAQASYGNYQRVAIIYMRVQH
jgi:hypothetical protein